MPPFPKPSFTYNYSVNAQLDALRDWRDLEPGRQIPIKTSDHLLLATWNIANLGVQQRRRKDYQLIVEMISWFDLIAVQECGDNLAGLRSIQAELSGDYQALFSDKAGNGERLVYLYDSTKVTVTEKVGEVAVPPADHRYIRLPGNEATFTGFDRNPYLAGFRAAGFDFVIVNNHIFFGDDDNQADLDRRALECYAVARWADLRRQSDYAYSPNIIAVGDFNLPAMTWDDPIYRALGSRGLYLVPHSSQIGSNIRNDKHYDQIAFFPGMTTSDIQSGIFDFDGALFGHLWDTRPEKEHVDFFAYMKYFISDHRILWTEFPI